MNLHDEVSRSNRLVGIFISSVHPLYFFSSEVSVAVQRLATTNLNNSYIMDRCEPEEVANDWHEDNPS